MKSNSKMVAAIFAVAIMMGCGLVPFATNVDSVAVTADGNTEQQSMSLSDIVEKIAEAGKDADSLDLGNMMFVKVDLDNFTPVDIPTDINVKFDIENEEYGTLGKDNTYTLSNGGYINVKTGGMLVIFPLEDKNGFTFVNKNDLQVSSNNVAILLSPGSILNIFGVSFKLMYKENTVDVKSNSAHLLTLKYSSTTPVAGENPGVTFTYTYNDGSFTLNIKIANQSTKVGIFRILMDGKIESTPADDIVISGKIVNGTNSVTISNCTVNIDARHGGDELKMVAVISSLSVTYKYSENGKKTINSGTVSFRGHIESMNLHLGNAGLDIVIEKEEQQGDIISGTLYYSIVAEQDTDYRRGTVVSSEGSVYIGASNLKIKPTTTDGVIDAVIALDEFRIELSNLTVAINKKYDVEQQKMVTIGNASKADVSMYAKSVKLENIILSLIEVDLLEIDNFRMDATSFITDFNDENNWLIKSNSFSVAGEIAKFVLIKQFAFGEYTLGLGLEFKDFYAGMEKGKYTRGYGLGITISTVHDGLTRTFTTNLDGISVNKDQSGNEIVSIKTVSIKNDLPLKSILKSAFLLKDNFYVDIELGTVTIDDSTITANTFTVDYKNYSVVDEVFAQANGKVTIKTEDENEEGRYVLTCSSITGWTKTGDDRQDFTHTNAKIRIGFDNIGESNEGKEYLIVVLHIMGGTATFNGGCLPMVIKVDSGAKFTANGLKGYEFIFENGADLSGTVSVDANSGINTENGWGYVKFVDGNLFKPAPYANKIATGCTMTVNITDKDKGWLSANANYTLPDKSKVEVHGGTLNLTAETGKIRFTATDAAEYIITCLCVGTEYTFTYEGGQPAKYKYHEVVPIVEAPSGCIGWTDGSGKVYKEGDIFHMPAMNVTMTPVKIAEKTPVVTGDVAKVDATGESVVKINPTDKSFETLRISVTGATVEISKELYDDISESGATEIYFKAVKVSQNANGETYDITLKDSEGNDAQYSGATKMSVTIHVTTDKDAEDFSVSYINELGQTEKVGTKKFVKTANGEYDVTFEVNHFSTYSIETVYKETKAPMALYGFLLIVLGTIGLVYLFRRY